MMIKAEFRILIAAAIAESISAGRLVRIVPKADSRALRYAESFLIVLVEIAVASE